MHAIVEGGVCAHRHADGAHARTHTDPGAGAVVERLRHPEHRASTALVWANGMYVTKHAVGLYGHRAPTRSWQEQFQRLPPVQEAIHVRATAPCASLLRSAVTHALMVGAFAIGGRALQASRHPPLLERYEGLARVEAYFITHARVGCVGSGACLPPLPP
jgi:hypothetical protein